MELYISAPTATFMEYSCEFAKQKGLSKIKNIEKIMERPEVTKIPAKEIQRSPFPRRLYQKGARSKGWVNEKGQTTKKIDDK